MVIQLNALYNKIPRQGADVTKKDCGLSVDLISASLSSTSPQGYSTQSIAELGNGESTNMVTIPSVTFNGVQ